MGVIANSSTPDEANFFCVPVLWRKLKRYAPVTLHIWVASFVGA